MTWQQSDNSDRVFIKKDMSIKKPRYIKKIFWIGIIGFIFWIILQSNILNNFNFEKKLNGLLDNKDNMTGQKFYDELTKLHNKLDRKLKQEYGTVQSLEYALDFKCLNDCKLYKSMNDCKRICMVPKVLIDNSDRGW